MKRIKTQYKTPRLGMMEWPSLVYQEAERSLDKGFMNEIKSNFESVIERKDDINADDSIDMKQETIMMHPEEFKTLYSILARHKSKFSVSEREAISKIMS